MINVTLGQYFPGNSLIHRLDPRMKIVLLLLLMISIFICKNFLSIGIVTALTLLIVLISRINLKTVIKGVRPIMIIVLFTMILNLFYGSGEPLVKFWIFTITKNGIINAVFMSLRIVLLVVLGSMLTYTTTPTALTDAFESLMKPLRAVKVDVHSIAMTMTIALRFIPTLMEEVNKIIAAQKSRGADIESGGLIKRAKAIVPIIIPLFISSFRRANELADAMECRCYRGGDGRTKMKVMHLQIRDYISLFLVLIYFTVLVLIRIFMASVI